MEMTPVFDLCTQGRRRVVDPKRSARAFHIRRLNDILHLSVQRNDVERAKRAWTILMRCAEVDWMALWNIGFFVLGHGDEWERKKASEYLKATMLSYPQRVCVC